jgi:hypothetical protein
MAKRNDPVARARGRKPAPVKKPFPVGFAVGCVVLVLFLGGILTYAVLNTSLGDKSSLKYAQSQIDGLQNYSGLKQNHTTGDTPVNYPDQKDTPPVGGEHNGQPQSCQVYTAAIANEHAVHSLEHGAVWVTYNPDKVSAADITTLKAMVDGNPDRLMSPYPGLKKAISLQAWGERVFVDKVSDSRVKRFLELFTKGPQDKEPNQTCVGTTATGPVTAVAPAPTPTPKASAAPTRKPTKK